MWGLQSGWGGHALPGQTPHLLPHRAAASNGRQREGTKPSNNEGRSCPKVLARKGGFLPFYLIIHFHRNMILFTNIQVRDCWSKSLKLKMSSKINLQKPPTVHRVPGVSLTCSA